MSDDNRTIEFSDQEWFVKSDDWAGPGPNHWSDSEQNVWVDERGQLHLRIRNEGTKWHCSEIYTKKPTAYGVHRFYIIGLLDQLDPNVVFASFLYKDDATEIDIEFTKWGDPNAPYNAQYVVQPWSNSGNMTRFPMVLNGDHTTHVLNWQPNIIQFQSIYGHYLEAPSQKHIIQHWTCRGNDIPDQARNLHVHINFWLQAGLSPLDGQSAEIIIKDVDLPNHETTDSGILKPI